MPSLRVLHLAAGRFGTTWAATALLWLQASLAMADHGAPAPGRTGLGWTSWLLAAGAVVAVSLAAWAFFAPDRGEGSPGPSAPDGARPEPPTR